jgi:NTP pyrophosphatase (non-canonical NTP hydrolase)
MSEAKKEISGETMKKSGFKKIVLKKILIEAEVPVDFAAIDTLDVWTMDDEQFSCVYYKILPQSEPVALREQLESIASNLGETINAGCDQDAVSRIGAYIDELFVVARLITQATPVALSFDYVRKTNVARCLRWHPEGINSWSESDWLTAIAGELGELASLIKMRNRERDGLAGNKFSPTMKQIADEIADVFFYLDLLAASFEIDLSNAIVSKFNEVSERVGFPDRMQFAPSAQHPDDIAVDRFAQSMKEKLAKKRGEGRGGWENKDECTAEFLSELLIGHVGKGDPIDVANFAMMLHQRGERIISPAPAVPEGYALVPIEPTTEMIKAGEATFKSYCFRHTNGAIPVWQSMVIAASTPPAAWDASMIKQPDWGHVQEGFYRGALESRANPDAMDADFRRAADAYTKLIFERVDPESERRLREGDFALPIAEAKS